MVPAPLFPKSGTGQKGRSFGERRRTGENESGNCIGFFELKKQKAILLFGRALQYLFGVLVFLKKFFE